MKLKRIFCVFLILCILPVCAFASDLDLSEMTYDELYALKEKITAEMATRPEAQTITLTAGFYQVGVDIPAGTYTMRCGKSEYDFVVVSYDDKPNKSGTGVSMPCDFYGSIHKEADTSHIDHKDIILTDGYYIQIQYGAVVFYAKAEETGS